MSAVKFRHAVSFRYFASLDDSIAIYSHCSNVHNVAVFFVFHHRNEDIFGPLSIVRIGLVDGFDALHGIWCRSLLGQMNNCIRLKLFKNLLKFCLLHGNINLLKIYLQTCEFFPFGNTNLNWSDGGDAGVTRFLINFSSEKVI